MANVKRVAIVGKGRAGKDTAGMFLGEITPMRYVGSTSNVVCSMIAKEKGISEQEAWYDRHNDRMFWKKWCDEYRKDDPARIAKACLEKGDIVIGIRGLPEIEAVKAAHLVNLTIWIENPRVPDDPTMDYGKEMADIVIYNDGDFAVFYERLSRLAQFAGLVQHGRRPYNS